MKTWHQHHKERIKQGVILLVAGLAVFLIYSKTLDCGFILDDKNNIEGNPFIRIDSLTIDSLAAAATKSLMPSRPVAYLSFALNYLAHGYEVQGFHLVNIFLHIATGIILYFLAAAFLNLEKVKQQYGGPGWVPLATAIIWMVHPVQAQTVNYMVQRMTILAALFYILAFFLYIKGRTAAKRTYRWLYLGGTLIAALFGLGSKETVAMLPLFLVLFELYFIQDFKTPPPKVIASGALVLFLFCVLLFFYLGKNPLTYIANSYNSRDFTLGERVLTQSRVVLFYGSLIFLPLPSRLNLEHDFPVSASLFSPLSTFFASSLIIMLVILAVVRARKAPVFSFCILWYFGNLLIESSVIGLEIIFEHRLYLPSMLVIMLTALWIDKTLREKWQQAAVYLMIISCLFSLTYIRNTVWTDTVSLLTDAAVKSPLKARTHLNLGIELKNSDRIDEAIDSYHQALALNPNYPEGYYNLGNALIIKGDLKEAAENFYRALRLTPYDVDTHYNLGFTLARLWEFDKAIYHYSEAIRLKPDFMQARKELADLRRSIDKLYQKRKPAQRDGQQ